MSDARPRVLVIEDNLASLLLTQTVLLRAGFEVISATSAEEGARLLSETNPAIILTDIQLPGIDGIELVRLLRADPAMASIPIVALSAHAMKEEEQSALDAGCTGFIRKPIDTRMLAEQVTRFLEKAQ